MQNTPHPMQSVRFGAFEVDFEAGELRKSGLKVALQEQPFHVLVLLLENAGKLVSRDDLQQKIWAADTFVEFDRGLNTAINKVRDALGDSAGNPRFIETVPRRGYRFLAPVEGVNGERPEITALSSPVPRVSQGRRFPIRLAALSVALAAAVGVIAWERFHRPEPGPDLPLRKFDLVLADLTPDTFPVISPDGQKIVYDVRTSAQPNRKLRVYRLDAGESYDLAGTEGGRWQFWSPDSEFIGFIADRAVCTVPVRGGTRKVLYQTHENEWLNGPGSWSPDGRLITFTFDRRPGAALYGVPASGGSSPKPLIQMSEKLPYLDWPDFVEAGPGSSLVVYRVGNNHIDTTIMLHNLDDGRRQGLTIGAWPAYSNTGHILYGQLAPILFRGIWALPVSLKTLKPTGGSFCIDPNGRNESVAKDGTLVYLKGGYPKQKQLVWLDRGGRKLSEIGQPQQDMLVPALSPDGRFVGVEGWESATGSDIWIHDIARSTKTRLTLDPAIYTRPVWSPDGKEVAFWSKGKTETFIQRVDGSGEAKAVPLDEIPQDWSRDGSIILGAKRYLTRKPDGSNERRPFLHFQTGGPLHFGPKLSPDGRFVAYVSHESGRAEVYVQQFPQGRKWQVSTNGGLQPRWCRNGELFYTHGDTLFAVAISTKPAFSMGATRELFSRPSLEWPFPETSYDVAADGNRFVMIEPVGPVPPLTIRVVQNWFAEFGDRKKANTEVH